MPQSLSLVLIHVVFSTKDRRPVLNPSLRPALHAYLAVVSRTAGCECSPVGGTADHVHLALNLARTRTVAGLVETLKVSSSKETRGGLRRTLRVGMRGWLVPSARWVLHLMAPRGVAPG